MGNHSMSCIGRNRSSGFSTRSDINWAEQPQMMARGLKFCIQKVEGLSYLCSENKGADQLRSSSPLFSHMQKAGFLMMAVKPHSALALDACFLHSIHSVYSVSCFFWNPQYCCNQIQTFAPLRRKNTTIDANGIVNEYRLQASPDLSLFPLLPDLSV